MATSFTYVFVISITWIYAPLSNNSNNKQLFTLVFLSYIYIQTNKHTDTNTHTFLAKAHNQMMKKGALVLEKTIEQQEIYIWKNESRMYY